MTLDDDGRKVDVVDEVEMVASLNENSTKSTGTTISTILPPSLYDDFLKTKSQTAQVSYIIFFYGNQTFEEIAKHIGHNKDAKWVSTRCARLAGKIEKKTDDRPAKWGLTANTIAEITVELQNWMRLQSSAAEKLKQVVAQQVELEKQQDRLVRSIEDWKLYLGLIEQEVLSRFTQGNYTIIIDCQALQRHSTWLVEELLDDPEFILQSLRIAIEKQEYARSSERERNISIVLQNIPEPVQISLRDLRSIDLRKLRWSNVEIELCSDVRPEAVGARFECPNCGNILFVLQAGMTMKEPTKCGCGRKGKFHRLEKQYADTAILYVTEPLGEILGSANVRTRVRAELQGGAFTAKALMRRIGPGVPAKVCFVTEDMEIPSKTGGVSRRAEFNLRIAGIEILDNYTFSLDFSEEEIEKFEEATKQEGFLENFCASAFPSHFGDEEVKMALLAQLVSGNFIGRAEQEQIHILLCGDPGVGKTKNFLMRTMALAPIAHLAQATNSSSAGLLGSAGMKDPYTNRQMFEPGVLPRHNRGIVCIDEVNALLPEDLKALNEALENGTVTIDKANIHTKAPSDVRVIGALNPRKGRFDDYQKITSDVLGVEPSFLDRFDCVFILRDRASEDRDSMIVDRMNMLGEYHNHFSDDWMRRFILYARDQIKPVITPAVTAELKRFYVGMRQSGKNGSIPISPRQYRAIRALTLCFAKLHLRTDATLEDVASAMKVMEFMFKPLEYDFTSLQRKTIAGKVENPHTDKCSYCGESKFLRWEINGNHCCDQCKTTEVGG